MSNQTKRLCDMTQDEKLAFVAEQKKIISETPYGRGIEMQEDGESVTIRITGEAFKNLKDIADIFGRWDHDKVTPGEMLDNTILDYDEISLLGVRSGVPRFSSTFAGLLLDMYRSEPDIKELETAFHAAGFDTDH